MTRLSIEQPLASPGSAKDKHVWNCAPVLVIWDVFDSYKVLILALQSLEKINQWGWKKYQWLKLIKCSLKYWPEKNQVKKKSFEGTCTYTILLNQYSLVVCSVSSCQFVEMPPCLKGFFLVTWNNVIIRNILNQTIF